MRCTEGRNDIRDHCTSWNVTVRLLFIAALIKTFEFDVRGAIQVVGRDAVRGSCSTIWCLVSGLCAEFFRSQVGVTAANKRHWILYSV
jgi:hypothetical protein